MKITIECTTDDLLSVLTPSQLKELMGVPSMTDKTVIRFSELSVPRLGEVLQPRQAQDSE